MPRASIPHGSEARFSWHRPCSRVSQLPCIVEGKFQQGQNRDKQEPETKPCVLAKLKTPGSAMTASPHPPEGPWACPWPPRHRKDSCLRPYLDVTHQLWQVEVPLLHEAGQLQDEAHRVVSLLQAGQTLHRPDCTEALGTEETSGKGRQVPSGPTHYSGCERGGKPGLLRFQS